MGKRDFYPDGWQIGANGTGNVKADWTEQAPPRTWPNRSQELRVGGEVRGQLLHFPAHPTSQSSWSAYHGQYGYRWTGAGFPTSFDQVTVEGFTADLGNPAEAWYHDNPFVPFDGTPAIADGAQTYRMVALDGANLGQDVGFLVLGPGAVPNYLRYLARRTAVGTNALFQGFDHRFLHHSGPLPLGWTWSQAVDLRAFHPADFSDR